MDVYFLMCATLSCNLLKMRSRKGGSILEKLVSIIIPVYNCEKYIDACIHSLQNQTYTNYEMIFVNDGSRDGSLEKLENAAYNDARIKIINQENRGVSSARNVGIDVAKGEYILFVDADDTVSTDYITNLITPLKDDDVDIVIDIPVFVFENRKLFSSVKTEQIGADLIKNYGELFQGEYNMALQSPCGKVYKKYILNQYNLKFNENIEYGEDVLFNLEYYSYINKYKLINKFSYFYYQRIGFGTVNKFKIQRIYGEVIGLNAKKNMLRKHMYLDWEKIYNQMLVETIGSLLNVLFMSKISNKIKNVMIIMKTISREISVPIRTYRRKQYIVLYAAHHRIYFPLIMYYFIKSKIKS